MNCSSRFMISFFLNGFEHSAMRTVSYVSCRAYIGSRSPQMNFKCLLEPAATIFKFKSGSKLELSAVWLDDSGSHVL